MSGTAASDTAPCGCCEGISPQTPGLVSNRPGLSQIGYRVGTYANFKASLLTALSDPANSPLGLLTTRDDSDFTIALLDAFAVTSDILTFYQERLANESYLRTATLPGSVFELARLVGYQPSPGVAATALLAVTLNNAPGAVDPATIPAGTPVQSVPAPGQSPATYETSVDLTAWVEQNALVPQTTVALNWSNVTNYLWLAGTSTGLNPGDTLLFVDQSRFSAVFAAPSALCQLTSVTVDSAGGRTLVRWSALTQTGFASAPITQSTNVSVYALRRRASLYGVNAPDPNLLPLAMLPNISGFNGITNNGTVTSVSDWNFANSSVVQPGQLILDSIYTVSPGLTPAAGVSAAVDPSQFNWVVVTIATNAYLLAVTGVDEVSPRAFGLSGKATRLTLDLMANFVGGLEEYYIVENTRSATVLLQSELLMVAPQPLLPTDNLQYQQWMLQPVEGNTITLVGGARIAAGQPVAISGQRVRLQLAPTASASFTASDSSLALSPNPGDIFLLDAPYDPTNPGSWSVLTLNGIAGVLSVAPSQATLLPADKSDPAISEVATLNPSPPVVSGTLTTLTFTARLTHIYDRTTVSVNANMVAATQGQTVAEILGSGAALASQTFQLKQSPLTFVPAASGQGAQSTLQVFVNDLQWQQAESFLNATPAQRIYVARAAPSSTVTVQFGDGKAGARPPTGQMNVRAQYRVGIGLSGMVQAGQLTQPIIRPPGLRSITNPAPATGGADPDGPDDARQSAPLHTLTLDRVVSLADYQNYALAFAGIAKATATWSWFNQTRGVAVTVAGAGGLSLVGSATLPALTAALQAAGDPYVPVQVMPCQTTLFLFGASILVDTPTYGTPTVLAAVAAALTGSFGFAARAIGQGVAKSEVVAAIQGVPGVLAMRLTAFAITPAPSMPTGLVLDDDGLPVFLPAPVAPPGQYGIPPPAGLLLLDTASLGNGLAVWQ